MNTFTVLFILLRLVGRRFAVELKLNSTSDAGIIRTRKCIIDALVLSVPFTFLMAKLKSSCKQQLTGAKHFLKTR